MQSSAIWVTGAFWVLFVISELVLCLYWHLTSKFHQERRNINDIGGEPSSKMIHFIRLARLVLDDIDENVHCCISVVWGGTIPAKGQTIIEVWMELGAETKLTRQELAKQLHLHQSHPKLPPHPRASSSRISSRDSVSTLVCMAGTFHRIHNQSICRRVCILMSSQAELGGQEHPYLTFGSSSISQTSYICGEGAHLFGTCGILNIKACTWASMHYV